MGYGNPITYKPYFCRTLSRKMIGMVLLLVVLFIGVPILELGLLLWLGGEIGIAWTLVIIVTTGSLGAALARRQGIRVLQKLREELTSARMPAATMFDGVLILIAGAFLITPGVLTDGFGFLLLVPPFRVLFRGVLVRWAKKRFRIVSGPAAIQDAEFEER